MSDTPRTDAVAERYEANEIGPAEVLSYAGQLERENAALRVALDDLCSVADSAMREANRHTAYSWEIEKELEPAMRALRQNQNP